MNTIIFPTWFSLISYGGLVCSAFTLVCCVLYAFPLRRGSIRRFIVAIACCVLSVLLLLPAFIWYSVRFDQPRAMIASSEMIGALAYLIICGWIFPLGVVVVYAFFTAPRKVRNTAPVPRAGGPVTIPNPETMPLLYQRRPGVPVPFVFDEETPWGWLEHLEGRLKGQRLELKRIVISLGRDEENDIWLDDDMASRHHADLTWNQGSAFVTDCQSMNGVQINGLRVLGIAPIGQHEVLQIGTHRLLFEFANAPEKISPEDDPLLRHVRGAHRFSEDGMGMISSKASDHGLLEDPARDLFNDMTPATPWLETGEVPLPSAKASALIPAQEVPAGAFVIRDGDLAGKMFPLDRPTLTIGRSFESDVVMNDVSLSRLHAQVLRQQDGEYIQDLGSRNGTTANEQRLSGPYRLTFGDHLCLGNIHVDYISLEEAMAANLPAVTLPPLIRPHSSVVSLHLPSRH